MHQSQVPSEACIAIKHAHKYATPQICACVCRKHAQKYATPQICACVCRVLHATNYRIGQPASTKPYIFCKQAHTQNMCTHVQAMAHCHRIGRPAKHTHLFIAAF